MLTKPITFSAAMEIYLQGKFALAAEYFQQLLQDDASKGQAYHMLGVIAAQDRSYDTAKTYLQQALQCGVNDARVHNHLGNVLSRLKQIDDAIRHYEIAIALQPELAEPYNNLGNVYYRHSNFAAAITQYQRAIARNPHYNDARYNLGTVYLREQDYESARITLAEIVDVCDDEVMLAKVQFQLGTIALLQQRFDDAATHLQVALSLRPDDWEARKQLGFAYLALNEQALAIRQFSAYLSVNNEDTAVHYNLAVLLQQQGEFDAAIYHFKKVLAQEPDQVAAHNNLGIIYLKQQYVSVALTHFQRVLALTPDNTGVQFMVHALTGDSKPAQAPSDFVAALYEQYANYYNHNMLSELDYQVPTLIKRWLATHYAHQSSALDILELGCGTGLIGKELLPYSRRLVGVDLAAAMLKLAAETQCYTQLHQGDLTSELTCYAVQYDLIVAADSLIYFGELTAIFQRWRSAIKSKGNLIFTVELTERCDEYILNTSGRYAHADKFIQQQLEASGWRIVNCQEVTLRMNRDSAIAGLLVHAQPNCKQTLIF